MSTTAPVSFPIAPVHLRVARHVPSWRAAAEGAAWGGLLAAIVTNALMSLMQHVTPWPFVNLLFHGLLAFLFIFAFEGIATLLWKIAKVLLRASHVEHPLHWFEAISPVIVGRLTGLLFYAFGRVLFPDSIFSVASATAVDAILIVAAMLSGALLGVAWEKAGTDKSRWSASVLCLAPLLLVALWLAWPGNEGELVEPLAPVASAPLPVENPGLPGPFAVRTLTYGSGNARTRADYGDGVALATTPVDGTPIFTASSGPGVMHARWRWGSDFSALPLNGRVWYPVGDGPFPLVLIVHGNHAPLEFSDPGYAYLGEHLASRGFIAASVDENFLNGNLLEDFKGDEIPLRAWLLLKHLEVWRGWNIDPGNQFSGKVDLERVALIGHSRGGEAVAHAADMNQRLYRPISEASEPDDFGFGIRGVVAIAPSDGFYRPQGRPLALKDVNYLTISGAHDADAFIFWGLSQYNRTTFTGAEPEAFKAAAYLYRANHGQFNSVWQYGDRGRYDWLLLNRAALLSEAEQQAASRTLIGAFLEATLDGEYEYRALFYQPGSAAAWFPRDAIVTQYQTAAFVPLDTNNRQRQLETMDVEGGQVSGEELSLWKTETLFLRDGQSSQNTVALRIGWVAGTQPAITFTWPVEKSTSWRLTPDDALTFALGSARDDYTPGNVTVVLETADGTRTTLPVDRFVTLQPPLTPELLKSDLLSRLFGVKYEFKWQAERVLQTVDIPLAAFLEATPDLQLEQVRGLQIRFDGSVTGEVFLDEVGLRRASEEK